MKNLSLKISRWFYTSILRRIFFCFDAEQVHDWVLNLGYSWGESPALKNLARNLWKVEDKILAQDIGGLKFLNPVGLAAGFDYKAKLPNILPSVGFGFGTVGTITNLPYEGNPRPRLGRLKKSRSLLVNKGFKNEGIRSIVKKLAREKFEIPIGISIGKTNFREASMTQEEASADIVSAFKIVEESEVPFAYYELNISCPNLSGEVEFYSPPRLRDLLAAVTEINLTKPVFIKMPINKSDEEVRNMLEVIINFPVAGVIFSNLSRNRDNPALVPEEVQKCEAGSFSGRPAEKRSNELVALAYKNYGKKLIIIGCGGIFTAEDAYRKIRLGASLVQGITGMVFEGPQWAGALNYGLAELLKKDGFKNISEAVGTDLMV